MALQETREISPRSTWNSPAKPRWEPRVVHPEGFDHDLRFKYEVPKDEGYFKNSLAQDLFQAIYVPLLSALPANARKLIRRTGKGAQGFIDNVTKHQAIEAMYTGERLGLLQPLWENTRNVRSIPNRLRIVTRELQRELIERHYQNPSETIHMVSIGAGSARSNLEAIESARLPSNATIELTFVDKDPDALKFSEALRDEKGIEHPTSYIESSGFEFLRRQADGSYDIIEIVGLMDYFKDRNLKRFFTEAKRVLKPGGTLVTGNIIPNIEQHFVGKAIGWDGMEYRTPDKLAALVDEAGLSDIHVIVEPLKIHAVAVAHKE